MQMASMLNIVAELCFMHCFACLIAIYRFTPSKDRTNELYKRVEESKQLKSRKVDAVIAACLYIALKQANVPRTMKGTNK